MNKNDKLMLTFDCGTQSLRAILFNSVGDTLGISKAYYPISIKSDDPDVAEQDAYVYWDSMCKASLELKSQVGDIWDSIVGVTLTSMRDTCVCLGADNEPVRNVIVWTDKRLAVTDKPFTPLLTVVFKALGVYESVLRNRELTKANYIREHEPEVWNKTKTYIMLTGFLNYKLTGNLIDSSACQVGHVPFDTKRCKWMGKYNPKKYVFNISSDKLPLLKDAGEILGSVSEEASVLTGITAGTPVIAGGTDKGCEAIGSGCIESNMAALSFGTASTIQLVLPKYVEPKRFFPAYPSVCRGLFSTEVQLYRGYWTINWFKNQLVTSEDKQNPDSDDVLDCSVETLLDSNIMEIPPGSDGLIMLPYWGAGIECPEARGAFVGFTDMHTKMHMYRSIIEGINFALMDNMYRLEKRTHTKINKLVVSGGGSQSNIVCQITADMFGLPVYRVQTYETSCLGSAIAGFTGVGIFDDNKKAVGSMVHFKDTFTPNSSVHKIYSDIYAKVYKGLYKTLKPTMIKTNTTQRDFRHGHK